MWWEPHCDMRVGLCLENNGSSTIARLPGKGWWFGTPQSEQSSAAPSGRVGWAVVVALNSGPIPQHVINGHLSTAQIQY